MKRYERIMLNGLHWIGILGIISMVIIGTIAATLLCMFPY